MKETPLTTRSSSPITESWTGAARFSEERDTSVHRYHETGGYPVALYDRRKAVDDCYAGFTKGCISKGASKVSSGVAPTVTMLLFGHSVFLRDARLRPDPVTKVLIRWAKGDPATAVCRRLPDLPGRFPGWRRHPYPRSSLTTAVLSTFKKMRINLVYLAVLQRLLRTV